MTASHEFKRMHYHLDSQTQRWSISGCLAVALLLCAALPVMAAVRQGESTPPPPAPQAPETQKAPNLAEKIKLSPIVQRLLDDPITTEAERSELRLFHGQWDKLDAEALDVNQRARLALMQYRLHDAIWKNGQVDPLLRAEAALRRSEPKQTLALLKPTDSAQAALLCAGA